MGCSCNSGGTSFIYPKKCNGSSQTCTESSYVVYDGPTLPNTGITLGDSLTLALQKIDSKLAPSSLINVISQALLSDPALLAIFCNAIAGCVAPTTTSTTTAAPVTTTSTTTAAPTTTTTTTAAPTTTSTTTAAPTTTTTTTAAPTTTTTTTAIPTTTTTTTAAPTTTTTTTAIPTTTTTTTAVPTTTTTTTTEIPTTTTTTTALAFIENFRIVTPQLSSAAACPLSRPVSIYTRVSDSTMSVGIVFYSDTALTIPFDGNGLFFGITWKGLVGFDDDYVVTIDANGVVTSFAFCPGITTTTTTAVPTTTTTTTATPIAVQLAFSSVSGAEACLNYPTVNTSTYYISNGGILSDGTPLYTDINRTILAPDGFYSNSLSNWEIPGGSGILANGAVCAPPFVENFRTLVPQLSVANACPLSRPTSVYTSVPDATMSVGTILYNDSLLTTPLNGNNLFYGITWKGSVGFDDDYGIQVDNNGVVTAFSFCPAPTTTTTSTTTAVPTTTTTTTAAPIPVDLAFSTISGFQACSDYPTVNTSTYYISNGSILSDGTPVYTDPGRTNLVPNGFYSNSLSNWEVAASSGILGNGAVCPPPAVENFRSVVPQLNIGNACGVGQPTSVYTSVADATMSNGVTLYTDVALSAPLNGNNLFYSILWKGSVGFDDVYGVQVDNNGVVTSFAFCSSVTTTTTTTTEVPTTTSTTTGVPTTTTTTTQSAVLTQLQSLYAICSYNPGTSGTTDADVYIDQVAVDAGFPYLGTGIQLYLGSGVSLNDATSIADAGGNIYNIGAFGVIGAPTGITC